MEQHPVCALHDNVAVGQTRIEGKLDAILEKLGTGAVTFATMEIRISNLEKLCYGSVSIALLAIGTAIMTLVMKS